MTIVLMIIISSSMAASGFTFVLCPLFINVIYSCCLEGGNTWEYLIAHQVEQTENYTGENKKSFFTYPRPVPLISTANSTKLEKWPDGGLKRHKPFITSRRVY